MVFTFQKIAAKMHLSAELTLFVCERAHKCMFPQIVAYILRPWVLSQGFEIERVNNGS